MKYTKWIFFSLSVMSFTFSQAQADTVIIMPNDPYYNQYQPDNGPMRGPNSFEAHKYGQLYDFHYNNQLRPYYNNYQLRPYYNYTQPYNFNHRHDFNYNHSYESNYHQGT